MSRPIRELKTIISNFHHAGLHYEELKKWYDLYVKEVHATYSVNNYLDPEHTPKEYIDRNLRIVLSEELGKVLKVTADTSSPFYTIYRLSTHLIIDTEK